MGNTLPGFRWECDCFILLDLSSETPEYRLYADHLPPETSAHAAEHEVQAQRDKLPARQFAVHRLRQQLARLFTTQHVLPRSMSIVLSFSQPV